MTSVPSPDGPHIRSRRLVARFGPVLAWAAVLCGLLLWPVTRGGYLLGHDMVFTPGQPLDLASIGVSSASPRAVPLDALVALAERVVNGAVVGRVAVVLPLLAAGLGVAVLLGTRSMIARLAACGFAIWNPYVIERLALGQWALLWCYASLPWLVLALVRLRGAYGWLLLALAVAAASITPTGGVIATAVAVAVAVGMRRPGRDVATIAAMALALQLPWLVPSLVTTAAVTSDPHAVAAFAARSEFGGGPLLSLLGGGGIWNADVVPHSRGQVLPWIGLAALVAVSIYGGRRLVTLLGARLYGSLAALAGVGLIVAIAPSMPGLDALVRVAVAHVPGAGLLRDAQKWIMPLVLLEALVIGAAADRAVEAVRAANWRAVLLVGALGLPLLLMPDGAVPVRTTVEPVHYPHDWSVVAARAQGGTATVLPFASYRTFPWAPRRGSVLDPAPRLLQVPTVVQDRLAVSGHLLGGEDSRAAAVARALFAGATMPRRLADLGIRWVVVERDTSGRVPDLGGLEITFDGSHVALYRVPGVVHDHGVAAARVVVVIVGDVLATVLLLGLAGAALYAKRRGRHASLL